jgi:predicted DNA-binding transcriptional regulator AlpA
MKTTQEVPAAVPAVERLLALHDLESILRVSTRTIRRLLARRQFPAPVRIGRSLRWRPDDLRAFIHERSERS